MACAHIKNINGRGYVYWEHVVDGKRRQTYCGRASDPESMKKARSFELADLRSRRDALTREIDGMDRRMAEIVRIDGIAGEPSGSVPQTHLS